MMVEREPDGFVFGRVLAVLRQMEAGSPPFGLVRYLELALLDRLGYRPELDGCLRCGKAWAPGNGWGVDGEAGGRIRPEFGAAPAVRPPSPGAVDGCT